MCTLCRVFSFFFNGKECMFLSAPWKEVLMDVVNTFVHSTVCKKKRKADAEQCLMSFLLSHSNRIAGFMLQ